MTDETLDRHIAVTPGVCGGKPRIAGHRITVGQIVVWYDRMGKSADEIAAEYDLELSDVYAGLAYYFDHREEIDATLKDSLDWIMKLRQQSPSLVEGKLGLGPAND